MRGRPDGSAVSCRKSRMESWQSLLACLHPSTDTDYVRPQKTTKTTVKFGLVQAFPDASVVEVQQKLLLTRPATMKSLVLRGLVHAEMFALLP